MSYERDLDKAYSLIPGDHRLNLHAIYLEAERKVERNAIEPKAFFRLGGLGQENTITASILILPASRTHWPTMALPLPTGMKACGTFWIEHCIASRHIGAYFGHELSTPAVTNIWIPDGYKDMPVDRKSASSAAKRFAG